MNFDGSICGVSGGVGFVIRDAEGRLLGAGDSFHHEPLVLEAMLRAMLGRHHLEHTRVACWEDSHRGGLLHCHWKDSR